MAYKQNEFFETNANGNASAANEGSEATRADCTKSVPDGTLDDGPVFDGTPLPGLGHNHKVYVRDLILDAGFHERRSYDDDEVVRLSSLVADPALHRPVPVIEKDGRFAFVDSTVFCKALLKADPDAMVEIEIVSETDGLAIRFRDIAGRHQHEPMSKVRLACMLVDADFSAERAGELLGVKGPRVSQLVAVARTEAKFEALAKLITGRSRVTPRFWSSIHDTRIARNKLDEKKPEKTGPSRVEKFEQDIAQIVADGEKISVEEIRKRLNLNGSRTASTPVRMRGTPVTRPDLKLRLHSTRVAATSASTLHIRHPTSKLSSTRWLST